MVRAEIDAENNPVRSVSKTWEYHEVSQGNSKDMFHLLCCSWCRQREESRGTDSNRVDSVCICKASSCLGCQSWQCSICWVSINQPTSSFILSCVYPSASFSFLFFQFVCLFLFFYHLSSQCNQRSSKFTRSSPLSHLVTSWAKYSLHTHPL